MRVLACGGRNFGWNTDENGRRTSINETEVAFICLVLDTLNEEVGISTLIEGEAIGADKFSRKWAELPDVNVKVEPYPADWNRYKRRAGPIRNRQMLEEGKPQLVVPFPGGTGTADMVSISKAAGVEVLDVDYIYNIYNTMLSTRLNQYQSFKIKKKFDGRMGLFIRTFDNPNETDYEHVIDIREFAIPYIERMI